VNVIVGTVKNRAQRVQKAGLAPVHAIVLVEAFDPDAAAIVRHGGELGSRTSLAQRKPRFEKRAWQG
jgi:hypothetical protein